MVLPAWWTALTMPQVVLVLGILYWWLIFIIARAIGER